MNCEVFLIVVVLFRFISFSNPQQWSIDKAQAWYKQQGWLAGCNFIPSTAENTLEMWQADTFDVRTIDSELGFAESLGFNIVRVFLHYLLWVQDPNGFKTRMDTYLNVATSHKIKTMFVLFDDCWNKDPQLGPQLEPVPCVHNSRWVQCPGQSEVTNSTLFPIFSGYVEDVIRTFANDSRVIMWDLYNEPGNSQHGMETFNLLSNVFEWARTINPSQPLTAGLWNYDIKYDELNAFQIKNSDIITFHDYSNINDFKNRLTSIKADVSGRPCVCSEYMARLLDSKFETHLPYMKSENVGGINWGLVSGKTQTIFPWWSVPCSPPPTPPKIWFHDIFYKNGTAFNQTEIHIIQNLTIIDKYY